MSFSEYWKTLLLNYYAHVCIGYQDVNLPYKWLKDKQNINLSSLLFHALGLLDSENCPCIPFQQCTSLQRLINLLRKGIFSKTSPVHVKAIETIKKTICNKKEQLVKCCDQLISTTTTSTTTTTTAEIFYKVNYVTVNYSVKNSTVDCKYLIFLQHFFFRIEPKQYEKCQCS